MPGSDALPALRTKWLASNASCCVGWSTWRWTLSDRKAPFPTVQILDVEAIRVQVREGDFRKLDVTNPVPEPVIFEARNPRLKRKVDLDLARVGLIFFYDNAAYTCLYRAVKEWEVFESSLELSFEPAQFTELGLCLKFLGTPGREFRFFNSSRA